MNVYHCRLPREILNKWSTKDGGFAFQHLRVQQLIVKNDLILKMPPENRSKTFHN